MSLGGSLSESAPHCGQSWVRTSPPQVLFGVKAHLDSSAATDQAKFLSNFIGGGGNPESLLQWSQRREKTNFHEPQTTHAIKYHHQTDLQRPMAAAKQQQSPKIE